MAEREWNVAHRNAVLTARGAIFNGGSFVIREGSRPGADATATGTVGATIPVPTPAFGTASGGSQASVQWVGEASASITPGHARLLNSGGSQVAEYDAGEDAESVAFTGLDEGVLPAGAIIVVEMTHSVAAGDAV